MRESTFYAVASAVLFTLVAWGSLRAISRQYYEDQYIEYIKAEAARAKVMAKDAKEEIKTREHF